MSIFGIKQSSPTEDLSTLDMLEDPAAQPPNRPLPVAPSGQRQPPPPPPPRRPTPSPSKRAASQSPSRSPRSFSRSPRRRHYSSRSSSYRSSSSRGPSSERVENSPCPICGRDPPCMHMAGRFRQLRPGEVHPRHRVASCHPPWAGAASDSTDPAGSLHSQICDFAAYVGLDDSERQVRSALLNRVADITGQLWQGSRISLFGSSANDLDWFGSDLDCTVTIQNDGCPREWCTELADQLQAYKWVDDIEARVDASVPIVCFSDRNTGVQVDIGFEPPSELSSSRITQLVHGFRPQDCGQFRQLMLLLKVLFQQHGLDKPFHGGLGSFKLGALMAQYLAYSLDSTPADNGQVLKGFLRYLLDFNFRHSVHLSTGARVSFAVGFNAVNLRKTLGVLLAQSENSRSGTALSRWIAIGPLVRERSRSLKLAKEECDRCPPAHKADDTHRIAIKRKSVFDAQFAPPSYKAAKTSHVNDRPEMCIAYE